MREAYVSAHVKHTKLVPLTAVLCLAAAAFGGYALAPDRLRLGDLLSTGGIAQTFTMKQHAVTATCTSGTSCTS
jgi:hypothetical protein